MTNLSAEALLNVWETEQARRSPDEAVAAVFAQCGGGGLQDMLAMSLGARNARLLGLRRSLFGDGLPGVADCPACGARAELNLSVRDLTEAHEEPAAADEALVADGYGVRFRLPRGEDLRAVADCATLEAGRDCLLRRCVIAAELDGAAVAVFDLPPAVIEQLSARMETLDPLAETLVHLVCPECGQAWQASLDVASFVWEEFSALARRLLREVHALASAYGWREPEILAMSAVRRRAYLELLN